MWCFSALFLLLNLFRGGGCLKVTDLKVPRNANLGTSEQLECHYELDGATLYSVKWYKDEFEFYRYMPRDIKKIQTFTVPGVHVLEEMSGNSYVTLVDLEYRTSGSYKCEVSTEAPDFNTSLQSKNMTVIAFPERPPLISGVQESYQVTEYIHANCSSGHSYPAPRLIWHVNDVEPDNWYVVDLGLSEKAGPLYARLLALQYPASKISLGDRKDTVTVNCTAVVGDMPPETTTVLTRVSSASANQQLYLERLHNSGVKLYSPLLHMLICVCILAILS